MDEIMIKVARIEEHLKNQDEKVSDIKKMLNDFICSADNKYASKDKVSFLEKIIYGTVGVVLTAVVLSGLDLILKK